MPAERGQDVSEKIKNRLDTQRWYNYLWIGERHHDTERTVSEIHTFLPKVTGSALSQHRVEGLLEVLKEYYCI
ncbi:MAG: hypothetical protein VB096_03145 [Pseudoflavonifractor sp.]|nr:hypothetical protein [Pseudoflavonifractor sp.]